MSKRKIFTTIGGVLLILLIFREWFSGGLLSSGDWHFLFVKSLIPWKSGIWAWDTTYGNGFGSSDVFLLPLNSYFLASSKFLLFFLPWNLVERIIFFWPYILLSFFSSYYFAQIFQKHSAMTHLVTFLLFSANTYALMLVGGGQMGVALAYSLSPLVLAMFAKIILEKDSVLNASVIGAGIILALQVALDIRIVYVTSYAIVFFCFFLLKDILKKKSVLKLLIVISITVLLNAFWLLPLAIVHQNPLQQMGAIYTSRGAVGFFSFAKFEDTFGLLHPNWPENVFGKVGFMRPEFLLLPILAYSSLLFFKKKNTTEERKESQIILFFAFIGLIGVFLAKGANDPFGGIYLWMFDHVPGFIMFRDPTKWYLLIVFSYMVLIPFTITSIYQLLKKGFV